jgi:beta-1,2-mannosidase
LASTKKRKASDFLRARLGQQPKGLILPQLTQIFLVMLESMKRALTCRLSVILLLAVAQLAGAQSETLGPWTRASLTPVISPRGDDWESAGTFNPAVVVHHGKFVMLYRAQDKSGTSRLGYAESSDGIHFNRLSQPVLSPEADYEKDGGVEDPRLVKFGSTYYLTYTGYNKKDAQLCLATSKDLQHWQRQGVILPAYKGRWNVAWTKSGAIVPEKINGKYWMYFLGTTTDKTDQTGLAYSTDLIHWTDATDTPVLPRRAGRFDSRVVEPGPAPVVTKDGIVLVYNAADDKLVYRTAIAVFDRHDPRKLLWRSEQPVFFPEKDWEKTGQVPNVVFVEGMARRGSHYLFYYGAADKYIGVAEVPAIP